MSNKLLLISIALISAVILGVGMTAEAAVLSAAPVRNPQVEDYARPEADSFVSALIIDLSTNEVLYEYQPDKVWVPASLTKLMSSQIFATKQTSWSKIVSLKKEDEVGGGRLRVSPGAQLSLLDVLYSTITASANNTATAMQRLSGLTSDAFLARMNSRAKELGCEVAEFHDASGMDPENKITAREISIIAKKAWSIPEIRKAADTASYSFVIRNTGEKKTIKNTNELLIDPDNGLYVTAGKTGYLDESLNNLVFTVRPSQPAVKQELMIVVLGAPTKARMFEVADGLAKWAWKAYDWNGESIKVSADELKDGELVKSSVKNDVYLVENGKLRPIISGEVFEAMGYKWSKVVTVPARVLESYPKAEIITLAVK